MPDFKNDALKKLAVDASKEAMAVTVRNVNKCIDAATEAVALGNYVKAAIAVSTANKELKGAYDALAAAGFVLQCDAKMDDMELITNAARESLIEDLRM